MADFKTRVDALTGLTSGTDYTTAELIEYLKDGVLEVTNRIVELKPSEASKFLRVTSELTSNGHDINGAHILSVVREDGTVNSWRQCREVPPGKQARVVDVNSLDYASKYHPVFIKWDNGSIAVYPAPTSSPNRYKIFYVNNVPTFSGGGTTDACDVITYFPDDKVYLVMLYSSIKCLSNALAAIDINKGANFQTSPAPLLTLTDVPTITSLSINAIPPVLPSLVNTAVRETDITSSEPSYAVPVLSPPDWEDANTWLNTEEDSEMVASRISIATAQISEYSAKLQEASLDFNKQKHIFDKNIRIAIQNAEMNEAGDSQKIQQYANEVQKYTSEVATEVQEYQQNLSKELQFWAKDNEQAIAKYQGELQAYQAQIQEESQSNTLRLSEYQADYEWMRDRLHKLQGEYDTAFILLQGKPPVQEQQQQRRRS